MNDNKTVTINRLPAPTWRWLKMNGAEIADTGFSAGAPAQAEVPSGIRKEGVPPTFWSVAKRSREEIAEKTEELKTTFEPPVVREKDLASTEEYIYSGAGPEADAWIEEAAPEVLLYKTEAGASSDEPLRLRFDLCDGEDRISAIRLHAAADSQMTVIMEYGSDKEAAGRAAVQTKLRLEKNALVRLVQIHRPGEGFTFLNDVGAYCAEGARLELIHLILSGGETFVSCRADLAGDGSSLRIDTAYLAEGESSLDFNYFANHLGKKTESEINADGVMRGKAKKIFRGTIDFKRGAQGAVGNEKEDVLLMDDTVTNKTIPLILCAEEDVVGNHGATIGRLDEQLLFYLESRGMARDEVYEMMARARLDALIAKIPDEATRARYNAQTEDE